MIATGKKISASCRSVICRLSLSTGLIQVQFLMQNFPYCWNRAFLLKPRPIFPGWNFNTIPAAIDLVSKTNRLVSVMDTSVHRQVRHTERTWRISRLTPDEMRTKCRAVSNPLFIQKWYRVHISAMGTVTSSLRYETSHSRISSRHSG